MDKTKSVDINIGRNMIDKTKSVDIKICQNMECQYKINGYQYMSECIDGQEKMSGYQYMSEYGVSI